MNSEVCRSLDKFLSRQRQVSKDTETWGYDIELEITGYLCSEDPPSELVQSVRAIVFDNEDRVLVMGNLDDTHIVPGGRVEQGETPEHALKRELMEEAGAEIDIGPLIGVVHLRHMTPKPKDYPFLYPDFLWPVFVASLLSQLPRDQVSDEYEISAEFLPIDEVRQLGLFDFQKVFLEAALEFNQSVSADAR